MTFIFAFLLPICLFFALCFEFLEVYSILDLPNLAQLCLCGAWGHCTGACWAIALVFLDIAQLCFWVESIARFRWLIFQILLAFLISIITSIVYKIYHPWSDTYLLFLLMIASGNKFILLRVIVWAWRTSRLRDQRKCLGKAAFFIHPTAPICRSVYLFT